MAGGKTDELKGRVKEAAGALTGDEKLKREGQVDQTVGRIKQKADRIIDKLKEAVKGIGYQKLGSSRESGADRKDCSALYDAHHVRAAGPAHLEIHRRARARLDPGSLV